MAKHLQKLWKTSQPPFVTSLGKGCYVVKVVNQDDYFMALAGGPWFLFDHYVSVQTWRPEFTPGQDRLESMIMWVQLHELPIEYYHMDPLYKIGRTLGVPIKVDTHTVESQRGRYARLCIEMDTRTKLPQVIQNGNRVQSISYEMKMQFCITCGVVGHMAASCSVAIHKDREEVVPQAPMVPEEGW